MQGDITNVRTANDPIHSLLFIAGCLMQSRCRQIRGLNARSASTPRADSCRRALISYVLCIVLKMISGPRVFICDGCIAEGTAVASHVLRAA